MYHRRRISWSIVLMCAGLALLAGCQLGMRAERTRGAGVVSELRDKVQSLETELWKMKFTPPLMEV
jgi:hypothetical protein